MICMIDVRNKQKQTYRKKRSDVWSPEAEDRGRRNQRKVADKLQVVR